MQFNGAYDMLKESEKMNFTPTASMYNAIMAGYFREVPFSVLWSSLLPLYNINLTCECTLCIFCPHNIKVSFYTFILLFNI